MQRAIAGAFLSRRYFVLLAGTVCKIDRLHVACGLAPDFVVKIEADRTSRIFRDRSIRLVRTGHRTPDHLVGEIPSRHAGLSVFGIG